MTTAKSTKNATANKLLAVEKNELGCALHTALRKNCDSDATSLAYNVVEIADDGWMSYLDLAWKQLQEATPANVVEKLRMAACQLEFGDAERNTLRLTFELFDDDDFEGMAVYIFKA